MSNRILIDIEHAEDNVGDVVTDINCLKAMIDEDLVGRFSYRPLDVPHGNERWHTFISGGVWAQPGRHYFHIVSSLFDHFFELSGGWVSSQYISAPLLSAYRNWAKGKGCRLLGVMKEEGVCQVFVDPPFEPLEDIVLLVEERKTASA